MDSMLHNPCENTEERESGIDSDACQAQQPHSCVDVWSRAAWDNASKHEHDKLRPVVSLLLSFDQLSLSLSPSVPWEAEAVAQ